MRDSSDEDIDVQADLAKLKEAQTRQQELSESTRYDLSSAWGSDIPTHHELVESELNRYLYPVNMPVRDYQRNIVKRALIRNIICALPTGLGKTFIASVVMWNFYRWTKTAKIIFVAPTRPLVTQQIRNYIAITGTSINDTCVFLPDLVNRFNRRAMWEQKRVFFATPQTIENDLQMGNFNPRDVVCLVIDEAHRATGNHSYVNLVREISKYNNSFRILALTATPAGKLEGVQSIIDDLHISAIEIRTEESLDVSQYTHQKDIKKILVHPDANLRRLLSLCQKLLRPLLSPFKKAGIIHSDDALELNAYMLLYNMKKHQQQMKSKGQPRHFYLDKMAQTLHPVLYAVNILQTHGIFPFYERMKETQDKFVHSAKPGKCITKLCGPPEFNAIMQACKEIIYTQDGVTRNTSFFSHPKLRELVSIMQGFYRLYGANSRCIIFADYRESVAEIQWTLEQNVPIATPSLFVGQAASSKGVKGMTQKEQQAVLASFNEGNINALVATSVAEEGLDISQVDLIICYDQSKSPIRNIQRMGRTGRARDGNVYMLMTEKESKKLSYALQGHKWVGDRINSKDGTSINLEYTQSPRILPSTSNQQYTEIMVKPPKENEEALEQSDILKALRPPSKRAKRKQAEGKTVSKKKKVTDAGVAQNATVLQWASELPEVEGRSDEGEQGDVYSDGMDGQDDQRYTDQDYDHDLDHDYNSSYHIPEQIEPSSDQDLPIPKSEEIIAKIEELPADYHPNYLESDSCEISKRR